MTAPTVLTNPYWLDVVEQEDDLGAPGASTPVMLTTGVAVQITGDATACTALVQRCTQHIETGAEAANWTTVATLTGSLAAGAIAPQQYTENGRASWRVSVTTLTGGTPACHISVMGNKG